MDLVRGSTPRLDGEGEELELAVAAAMLRAVAAGELPETVRVYRPPTPTVAFGRRDVRLPGLGAAVAEATRAGFACCVRGTGGRAAAYTRQSLVVDHVGPDPRWPSDLDARFEDVGALWVDALRSLGADARLGEVPGEFCPGAHSVNARGRVKLVGTAQRMVRGAWLMSAVLVVDDAPVLRRLLPPLYAALDLPLDEQTVGSLSEEVPGVSLDAVEEAVLAAYDARVGLTEGRLPGAVADRARDRVGDHVVPSRT